MNDTSNNETETEKKAKQLRTIRKVWVILIPIFTIVILINLYNWSQGKGNLSGTFSPLGMIFVGLASLVEKRNKTLSYALLAVGIIFALTGLVLVILNFRN